VGRPLRRGRAALTAPPQIEYYFLMKRVDSDFYQAGLHFKCQACGRCCQVRGEYAYVYVALPERRRLALLLQVPTHVFTRRFCEKTDGLYHLRVLGKQCIFLAAGRCSVYRARPQQCRTWPFWPENMNKKVWFGEVQKDCPGVGAGPRLESRQIEKRLAEAADSE